MHIRQFLVLPKLPKRIEKLQELAHNLWYSWNWEAVALFIRLDSEMWETCYQNPVRLLAQLPQEKLEQAAADDGFVASLDRVFTKYRTYIDHKKWYQREYPELAGNPIAYFSLEYGLDTGLPVYSGGLGVLSGDTVKSASDLGVPLVAVGLLYRYGYFRQFLSDDGWQQERYEENDWYHMPVELVRDDQDQPLKVSVILDGTPVHMQIWLVKVGVTPLYLLDANIPENATKSREITSVLYGGDKDMRIRQETILGIGGIRALKAIGIEAHTFHMNEGHSWFLTLERIRLLMVEHEMTFAEAMQYHWSTTVFTTHTPVPAGNERFDPVLLQRYLAPVVAELGISWEQFMSLGRVMPGDEKEQFGMTVAALRTSAFANGVSKLHGKVSREMWHNIWPMRPTDEIPINSVTNGVHPFSWVSHDLNELYESYLGSHFRLEPERAEIWDRVKKIPHAELWRTHNRRRERLVFFARKRLKQQLARRGASSLDIHRADQALDPQILTIGFARRFSTYKRGTLIFKDPDHLDKILNNEKCPVQIIFAGKAHPLDTPGKEIIKLLIQYSQEERFRDRIVFLEDYDINVGRYLVQGSDIWLNNPRRPEEASGTSGMKAAFNGVINLSILDGWWDEGYHETTGFKIGNGEEYDNVENQDKLEAEMLYSCLEREVVPRFYNLNDNGIPESWIDLMKASITMAGKDFSAHRMVMDYVREFYVPAQRTAAQLRKDNFASAKKVSGWVERMKESWDKIAIKEVHVPDPGATLFVGQMFPVTIKVDLGSIPPEDVAVEIVAGRLSSQEQILNSNPKVTSLVDPDDADQNSDGVYTFAGEVICEESGRFGITARIVPKNDSLPHTVQPKLISWW